MYIFKIIILDRFCIFVQKKIDFVSISIGQIYQINLCKINTKIDVKIV